MRRRVGLSAVAVVSCLVAALGSPMDIHAEPQAKPDSGPSSAAARYFTDVQLVNQRGQRMRLHSDILKGKVVVIAAFFSTCTAHSPVMMSNFRRLQQRFPERLGEDLVLISITVDPAGDTPARLAAYARQWDAAPGWLFLTGEGQNVELALRKLGLSTENKDDHSTVFIIGNEATGLWKKASGGGTPDELYPVVEEVLRDTN